MSEIRPVRSCPNDHDVTCWLPLPLWVCEYDAGGTLCGERRVSEEMPQSICRRRHEPVWRLATRFLSTIPNEAPTVPAAPRMAIRERLPGERPSYTRKFRLKYVHKDGTADQMKLYFTAGTYDDGRLAEVFVRADKTGSLASGTLDAAATMISLMLQYGIPLEVITSKLRHTRFGPGGFTGDVEFPSCSSPLDLLAQWLERRWGRQESES